jgi:hypothetical protein
LITLTTIAWAVVAAVAVWGITLRRASATIARLESEWRKELRHWQNDAARSRAHAAQLAQDAATWAAGCKQGRDDVITVVPLLVAAQERRPEPASKQPSAQYLKPRSAQYLRPRPEQLAKPHLATADTTDRT